MNLRRLLLRLMVLVVFSCLTLLLVPSMKASADTGDATPTVTTASHAEAPSFCGSTGIPWWECFALVDLYNSTDGPNWSNHDGWATASLACGWYGVSCESCSDDVVCSAPFYVVSLNLQSNQLNGTIPPGLGALTALKVLDLSGNRLSGMIPSELGGLFSLQGISLDGNELSGSIPSELGNLSELVWLNLDDNQLGGSIPPELGSLAKLQQLFLDVNQLGGSIPLQLGSLTELDGLGLSGNQLGGTIPPELRKLSKLGVLFLSNNQLVGGIPPELGQLSNLVALDLSRDRRWRCHRPISDPSICEPILLASSQSSRQPQPMALQLDYPMSVYPRSSQQWNCRGDTRRLSCQTEGVDAGSSGNAPSGAESLLDTTRGVHDPSSNQVSGSIPPELGNLTSLQLLLLSGNQLGGEMPGQLGNLTSLLALDLAYNQLRGFIPAELRNLSILSALDLNYNALRAVNPLLIVFLNTKQPGWANTQTVPPSGLHTYVGYNGDVRLDWEPIAYTGDGGFYEVYYGTQSGGPYHELGTTADKLDSYYSATDLSGPNTYHFVLRTFTPAHGSQWSDLLSDVTEEVTATIGATIAITMSPPLQHISVGGHAIFEIQVSNTSNVPLANVTVTDTVPSQCTRTLGMLAPDETLVYACISDSVSQSFVSSASVTGEPPVGSPAEDYDYTRVYVTRVELIPSQGSGSVGISHTVTSTVEIDCSIDECFGWNPLADQEVSFAVDGVNSVTGRTMTNDYGQARFTYTGTHNVSQNDLITAWLDLDGNRNPDPCEPSDTATVTWRSLVLTFEGTAQGTDLEAVRTITATVTNSLHNPVRGLNVNLRVVRRGIVVAEGVDTTNDLGEAYFRYVSKVPQSSDLSTSTRPQTNSEPNRPEATPADTETIEVWVDLNGNGAHDAGEPFKALEVTTAITLVSFTAQPHADGTVTLLWTTAAEIDNAGFNLWRATAANGEYGRINPLLIPGQGTGWGADYSYVDTPPDVGTYYYKLEDVDYNGVGTFHGPIEARGLDFGHWSRFFLPMVQH